MPPVAPSIGSSDGLLIGRLQLLSKIEVRGDHMTDEPLLFHDAAGGVNHLEPELVYQTIILVQNLALKEPEALDRICTPTEVHAGFIEFQFHTPGEESLD